MLAQKNRLRRSQDIRDVLKNGQRVTIPEVYIYFKKNDLEHGRIATIVGKKIHKQAVKRHRYQRWLRSLAADYVVSPAKTRSYDMVWVAQPRINNVRAQKDLEVPLKLKLQRFF